MDSPRLGELAGGKGGEMAARRVAPVESFWLRHSAPASFRFEESPVQHRPLVARYRLPTVARVGWTTRPDMAQGQEPHLGRGLLQEDAPSSNDAGCSSISYTHHPLKSWLNDEASWNMLPMDSTSLVSQAPMS